MDIHDILDQVFYKTDKETGERKISYCKLIIVVSVIFVIIGALTGNYSYNSNQTYNDSDGNNNNSIDTVEASDIEPFAEDTVVSICGENFTIPAGYGECENTKSEANDKNNDIMTHTGIYIYENENLSQITISYISQENITTDDSFLSDEGSLKTIGRYEGKLNYEYDCYSFNFMKNGDSFTIYAPTEKDIETILS